MWTHLEIDKATIETIFKPLYDKAKAFDRPWSIAELLLTEEDVNWLKAWLKNLSPYNKENWIKSVIITKLDDGGVVAYRQMFGAILICVAAEVCREENREDSVWPALRKILADSPELQAELFLSDGQPASLTKDIITDTVRSLNLRHAMDIEGTQQWFTTIKLQFGFTYRGARTRLAEWLVNLGRPHAIQYLIGDSNYPELASNSFKALWRALTQYRRNLITEAEIRETLESNPWIKKHWIDDLLKEAKEKILTLGMGDWNSEEIAKSPEDGSEEEFCPVKNIALEWPSGEPPRLKFQLDKKAIEDEVYGTDIGELDFYIDGRKLCRWIRQRDGAWYGEEMIFAEPDRLKHQPNLKPKVLSLQSVSGEILAEWDFSDSNLSDEVLVFNLDKEKIVNANYEQLEPNRHYAIICDRKCKIQGCDAVETFARNNIHLQVVRLPSPLNQNLCVVYEDFVLWQPVREKGDKRSKFSLTLSTPNNEILSFNDRTKLLLTGLPEEAEDVRLLIHRKMYDLERHDDGWLSLKDITLTPELAARQRRIRVRFLFENRSYTWEPRLDFSLLGAAMYRHNPDDNADISFEVLKKGEQLNRSEGTNNIRIWIPEKGKGMVALEANYKVGRLRHQKVRLRDFPGHGGQINVVSEGNRYNLGVSCIDKGCVKRFVPPILGGDAHLFLLSDKNPVDVGDDGYSIYIWYVNEKGKAKFQKIPPNRINSSSRDRIWKIKISNNPMAVSLTWKGSWIGAWWNIDSICNYVSNQTQLSEKDFAIMKWLRVPVLNSKLTETLAKAICNQPGSFINAWLKDKGLPSANPKLKPHGNLLGVDSVIRHFFWNDIHIREVKEIIGLVTGELGTWYQGKRCIANLQKLADVSPTLLWKGFEYCLKHDQYKIVDILNNFIRIQVGLLSNAPSGYLNRKMIELRKSAANATTLSEEEVDRITNNRILSLHNKIKKLSDTDYKNLLILGETISGRKYISAKIAKYWIDLSQS